MKPNQELKYVNSTSQHTLSCLSSIPSGVVDRLTKLTTLTSENADARISEIYPDHFEALRKAQLIDDSQVFPPLKELKVVQEA